MPRKAIKRLMPDHNKIREHKYLQHLGHKLHDPNLWHLNRKSAAGAFAVGLFFAWMPVPMQMFFAAISAIIFRVNLPISVALVWISNPFTMPPMFYGAYLLGVKLLGGTEQEFSFEISIEWLIQSLGTIALPLLLGCVILGAISSAIAYIGVRMLWRMSVIKEYKSKNNR